MCLATVGIMGCKGLFRPLPTLYLGGPSAAAGIALINSVDNLGGFFGPGIVGMAREATGNFASGLYLLAGLAILRVLITVVFLSDSGRSQQKEASVDPVIT